MTLSSPILDVILLAHVVVGFVGYGSLALNSLYLRKFERGGATDEVREFFDGKTNKAQWFVYLVPVFGVLVMVTLRGATSDLHQGWFIVAVLLWFGSAGIAGMTVYPRTKDLGIALMGSGEGTVSLSGTHLPVARVQRAIGVCSVAYVVAFYLMLFKP